MVAMQVYLTLQVSEWTPKNSIDMRRRTSHVVVINAGVRLYDSFHLPNGLFVEIANQPRGIMNSSSSGAIGTWVGYFTKAENPHDELFLK
jgi:uncharacterized protein YigE (DUF2233 family)